MRYKYKLEGKIPENKTEIKGGNKTEINRTKHEEECGSEKKHYRKPVATVRVE